MTKRDRLFVLNDPYAMRVSKQLAMEIGLKESIVLLQIDFLLANTQYVREGKPWIRMTLADLKSQYFDFLGRETLRRTIESLQQRELIIIGNFNRRGFDRTQWITLNVVGCSKLNSLTITHFEPGSVESVEDANTGPDGPDGSGVTNSQVNGVLPLDDPELLTDVDASSTDAITRNELSTAQNGTSTRADRVLDGSERDVDVSDLGDASHQNGSTIDGRDLEKRLTSSGRDAPRPSTAKRINVGKLLSEILPAGHKFPRSFKGHLGSEMKRLAKEGIDEGVIRDAAVLCIDKGLNPANLPSLAVQVRTDAQRAQSGFQTPDQSEYAEGVFR